MYKIKDDANKLIYEGLDGNEVYRVLTAEPEDISEEDEVKYESILRNKTWIGKLRLLEYNKEGQIVIYIKFKAVDDWGRPCFKDIDRQMYYGDVNKLWYGEEIKDIEEHYRNDAGGLEYFGASFNCEPHGGLDDRIKLIVI